MKKYCSRLAAVFLALALLAAPASALTVDQALELLEENYYYDIPEDVYESVTLDELFWRLGDPYTGYMSAETYEEFLEQVEDTVNTVGIGVEVNYTEDGLLVRSVISGGSAQKAGLLPGDVIVAIEGVSCAPAQEEHRQRLLGAEGTEVTITVRRDGADKDYVLTRCPVYIPNTEISLLESGVGYIDCNSFGLDTGTLFAQVLKEHDSEVSCWLLDLRDNVGGYADSAVEMMLALDGMGHYLYFEDQSGHVSSYGGSGAAITQKPLIVLVNGESASASELLASNVRDTGRGIIVGERTFGKGIAQSVLDEQSYPDYFDGDCLKVTTARFYSASGNTTDKIGVIPTLLVDEGYEMAVAAALTGGSEETSLLCIVAGSTPFYVDPSASDDVVSALLEAVPPLTPMFYSGAVGGTFKQVTPAQAAEKLGLDYDSRWFDDVTDSSYATAINTMGTYRLLNGTAPGRFNPTGELTRAQLCVMLARVLNVTYRGPSRFSDVAAGSWYDGEVNAMAELGLVDGMGGGKFNPDSPVTQQQFLTIMGRTARYLNFALDDYGEVVAELGDELPEDMLAGLEPYANWAKSDVAVLAWGLADMLDGTGNLLYTRLRNIDPSAPVLREQAAAEMYAVLTGLGILP